MDVTSQHVSSRPELLAADDATIEDAIAHADPMVLRGLLYQLTGDPEVAATGVKMVMAGYFDVATPASGLARKKSRVSDEVKRPLWDSRRGLRRRLRMKRCGWR